MGLDVRLTRYHRIGSPTDPLRVLNDRPIECAICHAEKTVGELISAMEHLWHKTYDADVLRTLYGEDSAKVMQATLVRGKPHEQAIALAVLGNHATRDLAPLFARQLDSEYPLVREYARAAMLQTLGPACELSMYEGANHLRDDAEACLRAAHLPTPTWSSSPEGVRSEPEPAED
jgi:hypothetical protein